MIRAGRPTEFGLILLASGATLAAAIPVADPSGPVLAVLGRPLVLIAMFVALHVGITLRRPAADQVIAPTVLLLMGLGLSLSRRLVPALDERQFAWLIVGALVILVVTLGPDVVPWLRRYPYSFAIGGLALVVLTLFAGSAAAGAGSGAPRLWLQAGPLHFQPSELLKLVLVIFLAGYLSSRSELLSRPVRRVAGLGVPPIPYLAPLGLILGASLLLMAAQRDLGAALILYLVGVGMIYLASGNGGYVLAATGAFALGAYVLHSQVPVVALRAAIWLDPWSAAQGGYQIVQALMAIGAGGVAGTGLGQGLADVIPVVHSDFVYAAIAEELGVAGAAAVLALYGVLFWRGWRGSLMESRPFEAFLGFGLTLALAVQTIVIVGGILRLIPLTGITLPFLSYGGTSLVTSAFAVGAVLRLSDRRQ